MIISWNLKQMKSGQRGGMENLIVKTMVIVKNGFIVPRDQ